MATLATYPCYEDRPRREAGGRGARPGSATAGPRGGVAAALELLDWRVAQDQVLDAVLTAEVDLRLRVVTGALHGHDGAQAVGVVGDLVPRRQGGHPPVAGRAHAGPLRQALRGRRGRRGLVAA